MVYITAGALIIAVVWSLLRGLWYLALPLYIVGGILWVAYDMRCPLLYRPMGYLSLPGAMFLLAIWPLRTATNYVERRKLRGSPERYVALGEDRHRKHGTWDDAIRDAKEEAKSTGKRVMVLDTATFAKQFGRVQHKSWFVEPNGNVECLPRSLL